MSLTSLSLGLVRIQWIFEEDIDLTFLNKLYILIYYGKQHVRMSDYSDYVSNSNSFTWYNGPVTLRFTQLLRLCGRLREWFIALYLQKLDQLQSVNVPT